MNPTTPACSPAVKRWSTDAVGPRQRLDYWVGAICEAFLEMECSSRQPRAFDGSLVSVPCDAIAFNQVRSTTQDVYRTPAAIARGRQHPFYLITQRHSSWHVRQGGHMAQLRPGDAVLVDSARAYELHFPDSVDCLSIQLPRAWAGRWLDRLDCELPRVVARDRGWGRALSALCLQMGEEPQLAQAYPSALLADQVGAMLAAALEPAAAAASSSPAASAMGELLRQRLDEPGLSAADLARALGISVRSLHRSFAAQQATFGGTLRQLRLARAAELLAQPRLARLGVGEVGRRVGYTDASHFVREFQRLHGQTPARWRRSRLA
jgi:AraC-like DNA-binding protein